MRTCHAKATAQGRGRVQGSISSTHSFVSAVARLLDKHGWEIAVFAEDAAVFLAAVAELDPAADLRSVDARQRHANGKRAERLAEDLQALIGEGGQFVLGDGIVERIRRGDDVEHVVGERMLKLSMARHLLRGRSALTLGHLCQRALVRGHQGRRTRCRGLPKLEARSLLDGLADGVLFAGVLLTRQFLVHVHDHLVALRALELEEPPQLHARMPPDELPAVRPEPRGHVLRQLGGIRLEECVRARLAVTVERGERSRLGREWGGVHGNHVGSFECGSRCALRAMCS